MMRKGMLKRAVILAMCAALMLDGCGAVFPAYAAIGETVYTFGDPDASFRDLAAEHQKEVERRKAERRKEERKQVMQEKAAMKKAAREARGREQKDKAAKEDAGE